VNLKDSERRAPARCTRMEWVFTRVTTAGAVQLRMMIPIHWLLVICTVSPTFKLFTFMIHYKQFTGPLNGAQAQSKLSIIISAVQDRWSISGPVDPLHYTIVSWFKRARDLLIVLHDESSTYPQDPQVRRQLLERARLEPPVHRLLR